MPLPEISGALGLKRAAHLLRRATFGATRQRIDAFAVMTAAQAIEQLYRQPLTDPLPPIDPKTGSEWVTAGETGANSEPQDLEEFFKGWFIGQMLSNGIDPQTNASLTHAAREKIVFFLHTHFTTIQSKVSSSRALYFQNALYRKFALDAENPEADFKKLTVKVSVDNAMLRLLDGALNVKGSVNENYARELLELYTIGRGLAAAPPPTSGDDGDYGVYTEEDVKTAARILSGWDFDETFSNIDPDTELPRGKVKGSATNASSHDSDTSKPKQFSSRFVSTLFPGNIIEPDPLLMPNGVPTEESALDEITKLIDLIYEQPETALNICRKIYRFFVWAPHTTQEVLAVEGIIQQMADTFTTSGFKIQPVIENLLRSRHFYDSVNGDVKDDNFGSMIKSPLDLILGTLRIFNIQLPDMQTQPAEFYEATADIIGSDEQGLQGLGMRFFEPYDVAGYEAYHQFPIYHRFWITPNSLARRYQFILKVVSSMEDYRFKVDLYEFVRDNFNDVAGNARQLIITLANYFLPMSDNMDVTSFDGDDTDSSLTTKRLNYFKDRFLQ